MQSHSGTKPTPARKALPRAESTARRHVRRLRAVLVRDKRRSRLLAAAGLESPLSAMEKAALQVWNDEAIFILLRLVGRDIPPRRLLRI